MTDEFADMISVYSIPVKRARRCIRAATGLLQAPLMQALEAAEFLETTRTQGRLKYITERTICLWLSCAPL